MYVYSHNKSSDIIDNYINVYYYPYLIYVVPKYQIN